MFAAGLGAVEKFYKNSFAENTYQAAVKELLLLV
jgi:hypothetical protein